MTTLWTCFAYSAGLPVAYPIAAVSFFIFYYFYKFMSLKVYAKTTDFDEELPVGSVRLLIYGVMIHMFIAAFMFTNQEIFERVEIDGPSLEPDEKMKTMVGKVLTVIIDRLFSQPHTALYTLVLIIIVITQIFGDSMKLIE